MFKSRLTVITIEFIVLLVVCFGLGRGIEAQNFTEWSAPQNLSSVNSDAQDGCPAVSRDGLSLYFASRRAPAGTLDIYVSQRDSLEDPWKTPVRLGSNINTDSADEFCPALSTDGHTLFFASNGPGCGGRDLYFSNRKNNRNDFGWSLPQPFDCGTINTSANDWGEVYWESENGISYLYFTSNRVSTNADDIYVTTQVNGGPWSVPVAVAELNTSASDKQPAIRRDGLELILSSSRTGGQGLGDLWVSTRNSTSDPWSAPVNLNYFVVAGSTVNSSGDETRPALSWNGTELYFGSTIGDPDGDLYLSTREK
jgi:WD40-like Beta Propeller Repeat